MKPDSLPDAGPWRGFSRAHVAKEPDFWRAIRTSGGRDYYAAACGSAGVVGALYNRPVDCPDCLTGALMGALLAAFGLEVDR